MTKATITASWSDATYAYLSASVAGDDPQGLVEYIAQTPLMDSQGNAKSSSQLLTELTAALCAKRKTQLATKTALGLNGTISV